jgi:hypothetical protein
MKASLRCWASLLPEAERELEAASTRSDEGGCRKLMPAKVELKHLQAKVPPVEG